MQEKSKEPGNRIILFRDVSFVVGGILIFAIFIHHSIPLRTVAYAGLAGAAILISYSTRYVPLLYAFGLSPFTKKILIYIVPAFLIGGGLGVLTRHLFDLSLLPQKVTRIAIIAPLVGITEEVIFRGYIQGYMRPAGRVITILYSSAAHTLYKILVIYSLSIPLQINFLYLALLTFLAGILFGTIRELSDSVVPPSVAHALFDIVLYGGFALAPVWVWS